MSRIKRWTIQKPDYIDILLKIFVVVLALGWCVLFFVIVSTLENRDKEIQIMLRWAGNESVRSITSNNDRLVQNQQTEGEAIPEPIYRAYENIVEYLVLNDGYASAIVDLGEDGSEPKIIKDNFTPKVFSSYIPPEDYDTIFSFVSYRLYEDDPQLTEFLKVGLNNTDVNCQFEADVIYVNEYTREFIPESVRWVNNVKGAEVIDSYTRHKEIPDGFVKDEKRNIKGIFQEYLANYAYTDEHKWYEPISEYGDVIQLLRRKEAAQKLREQIESGTYHGLITTSGVFGTCYSAYAENMQFMESTGELRYCVLMRAIQYNLWEFYRKSIMNTYLITAFAAFLFSVVLAYIIYVKRYTIWQQNAFCRTLTNAVAHDLKTPLMVISGMADNLKESVSDEKPLYYAEQVTETVSYMDRMIEDILVLNRLEGKQEILRTEKVDIVKLLEEVQSGVSSLVEEKKLVFTIQGAGKCDGDYALLRQAFGNLVDNAVKYTPDGQEIRVEISNRKVVITNTGVTLPRSFIRKAFDPFTKKDTARSNRKGSGVGLTIAKNIFEVHGMKCRLHSNADAVSVTVSW